MANITAFLQKAFHSLESSIVLPLNKISYYLVQSAKSITYVETLGEHADSLHSWIKQCYEEDLQEAFQYQVKKALSKLPRGNVRLAFDVTPEPFYGKTSSLYLFNTGKDHAWGAEFHFLNVHLITQEKQIPLMALPLLVGEGTARKTILLLDRCQRLFKRIRLAVFDRGFYIAELIDYLEANKLRYLMLVPEKKGRIKGYVESTRELGKFRHTMSYSKEKSTWKTNTTIVVCKGINDFPWIFATNIRFKTRVEYIVTYKGRWQIETNFRVEDEARVKSKSTNHLVRYFYHLVGLLLHLLWIVHKRVVEYAPFKRYLHEIEQLLLLEYLEIRGTS